MDTGKRRVKSFGYSNALGSEKDEKYADMFRSAGNATESESEAQSAPQTTRQEESVETDNNLFTLVGDYNIVENLVKVYKPNMEEIKYTGRTDYLLEYMVNRERTCLGTLSFKHSGVDPVVFENAEALSEELVGEGVRVVTIATGESDVGESSSCNYEMLNVDGELYLSCIDTCLDTVYWNQVVAEASTTLAQKGKYIYPLVGYKPVSFDNGETFSMLWTLKLNSYEMSALTHYMTAHSDVKVKQSVVDGASVLIYTKET